jgi:hypothetical protein
MASPRALSARDGEDPNGWPLAGSAIFTGRDHPARARATGASAKAAATQTGTVRHRRVRGRSRITSVKRPTRLLVAAAEIHAGCFAKVQSDAWSLRD